MRIIEHGSDNYEYEKECPYCGCKFTYTNHDVINCSPYYAEKLYCRIWEPIIKCPECYSYLLLKYIYR